MDEFTGGLREVVAVENWVGAADDAAGVWAPAGEAFAALVPVARTSDAHPGAVVGEGRVSRPRYTLTLRARGDVGLASRFRWRERTLAVLRIDPDPRLPDRTTMLVEDRT